MENQWVNGKVDKSIEWIEKSIVLTINKNAAHPINIIYGNDSILSLNIASI
jgi:hypothetical protein